MGVIVAAFWCACLDLYGFDSAGYYYDYYEIKVSLGALGGGMMISRHQMLSWDLGRWLST